MASPSAASKGLWHIDNQICQIDMRIDLIRMDFYRLLVLGRSEEDFYIEEAFNCFLSAVQSPLNFALYRNDELIFHFVNDVKYKDYFTKELNSKSFKSKNLLPFFPQLFSNKIQVCVFLMNTKEHETSKWITPIIPKHELELQAHANDPFASFDRYLERSVWRFFVDEWDAFNTGISSKVKESIDNSITEISLQFEKNLTSHDSDIKYKEACFSLNNSVERISNYHMMWHQKVRNIFERSLSDSKSGLEAQMLIMTNPDEDNGTKDSRRGIVPNMIFAYRSFTRDSMRSGWSNADKGYYYDTQFLIRDENGGDNLPVVNFFNYLASTSKLKDGISNFEEGIDRNLNPRLLYKNVFKYTSNSFINGRYKKNKNALKNLNEMAGILDDKFWLYIKENGAAKCIKILQSPVGINSRSFVDPVYHTGLIHFNSIFELGGLDRVGKKIDHNWNDNIRDKFIETNFNDLMRIVMLYYLFSEMSDWGGRVKNFNPTLLEAVLVPIKMRGSVWAVTLHAVYKKNFDRKNPTIENYQDVPRWISIYHICTTLRQKNHDLFDKTLWENTQRRVIRLLEKGFEKFPDTKKFKDITDYFNSKIYWEQRYVPYALPKILRNKMSYGGGTVTLLGASGQEYNVNWDIKDNPYFVANQPWSQLGTRSFQTAIEIGLNRGLSKLVNYVEVEIEDEDG